jgi:hypothetical protein
MAGRNGASLASRYPLLYRHSKRKNMTMVQALHNDRWFADVDHDLTGELIHEYIMLWGELQHDTISWIMTPDGSYSARSTYALHSMGRECSATTGQVWDTKEQPKCKFFYLALHSE